MRFLLKAITNFQSSKRQTRHKISTEKLPTTQEIVRNWEIRKICQQSAKFALLTIFSLCRKSKRSKPKMDNLKKVLTNRPELAGCLYKYTNVVKGKFDLFSWQNIYLHNYLRNSRFPASLLSSWCWEWHLVLLLVGESGWKFIGKPKRPSSSNGSSYQSVRWRFQNLSN